MQLQTLLKAVKRIQAADKRWIPEELTGTRYFSVEDLWIYIPHYDVKLCDECAEFALGIPYIPGSQLRSTFPWLEIKDENTIAANVHPNCRCELVREGTETPKNVLSKEEAKQAFITRKPS